jgi:hypothetical protein
VGAGLALRDGFAELGLEVLHVVVLEHCDHGAGETGTEADGGVVELIGDHEAALANNGREGGRVGNEAHGEDHGRWLANELGDQILDLECELGGTAVGAWACH